MSPGYFSASSLSYLTLGFNIMLERLFFSPRPSIQVLNLMSIIPFKHNDLGFSLMKRPLRARSIVLGFVLSIT
mgnify:CR=1 FL=1